MSTKFKLIPCPHEETVSWGKGTKNGPKAIINASNYLEDFDEELLDKSIKKSEVEISKPVTKKALTSACSKTLRSGKIPIVLGGEHSISPNAVKAVKTAYPDLSVLHLDAHADLRDSYQGTKESHACAARRMQEICPVISVGVRSISKEEYKFAKENNLLDNIFFGNNLLRDEEIIGKLSKNVYISFDVDVFDPGIMPSTGTPEPGGLTWLQVLNLFKKVCREKNIVGADFVELAPIKGLHAPDFMVAKLVYKLMGYLS